MSYRAYIRQINGCQIELLLIWIQAMGHVCNTLAKNMYFVPAKCFLVLTTCLELDLYLQITPFHKRRKRRDFD